MLAVFNQVSVLFILLVTGFIIRRLGIIDGSLNGGLINYLVYVALPSLAISSMNYEFSVDMLINSGILLIISMAVYAFSIAFSYFIPRLFNVHRKAAGVFKFCTVFSNVGFMGYPVVYALYGREGVFYTVIYNIPFNFLIWTLGVMVISSSREEKARIDYRQLLNPGIIAAVLGFFMFLLSVELPWPLFRALEMLGNTTTPLSMIVVGSILANIEVKHLFNDAKVFGITLIRLVLLPLMVLSALKLIGLKGLLVAIPVLITAMPVAANTAILAEKYGGDSLLGSKAVFISTLFSIITLPAIIYLTGL